MNNVDPQHVSKEELTFRPVTMDEWQDLQSLFSNPGVQSGCWCMYWRIKRSDFNRQYGDGNREAMQHIVESGRVPGILAYFQGRPIGWCSVAPREEFGVLDRSPTLKRVDGEPVWSIVCFFVLGPYRRKGLTKILIEAAIEYARANGARIIEAYPLIPDPTKDLRYEEYMGLVSTFEALGFEKVIQRSKRRPIMRYYVSG